MSGLAKSAWKYGYHKIHISTIFLLSLSKNKIYIVIAEGELRMTIIWPIYVVDRYLTDVLRFSENM